MFKLSQTAIINREAILDMAEDMYVTKMLGIREIVYEIRSRGRSITIWRLIDRLKTKGMLRSPTQTFVLRRENGLINNCCVVKNCTNVCSGRRKYCDTCIPDGTAHRAYCFYGITQPQVDAMLIKQNGVCAGCKCVMIRGLGQKDGKENAMSIDHDHLTGIIRGLLCHSCNRALGFAHDNANTLRALAIYLETRDI